MSCDFYIHLWLEKSRTIPARKNIFAHFALEHRTLTPTYVVHGHHWIWRCLSILIMVKPVITNCRIKRIIYEEACTIRKLGADFRVQREAQATAFVREHELYSIPVPKTFSIKVGRDDGWILTQRVSGISLDLVAWPDMNGRRSKVTVSSLKSHLHQLRDLHPTSPGWRPTFGARSLYMNISWAAHFHAKLFAALSRQKRKDLYLVTRVALKMIH